MLRVRSLALLSGLRMWHCCELWCRLQMQLGSRVAVALVKAGSYSSNQTPSLGTSIWCRSGPRKGKKAKRQKKKKEVHGLLLWFISVLSLHLSFFMHDSKTFTSFFLINTLRGLFYEILQEDCFQICFLLWLFKNVIIFTYLLQNFLLVRIFEYQTFSVFICLKTTLIHLHSFFSFLLKYS